MIASIGELVRPVAEARQVSVGFPGAVRKGVVRTAPNIGGEEWHGANLADQLAERLGRPVRLANDATVQGLGAISGIGLECAITLGTGMGFAVFQDGLPAVHLELGQHLAHKGKTYDQYVGKAALEKVGPKRWNRRLATAIAQLRVLVNFDFLYIGGGNAKRIAFTLPRDVHTVSNVTGILGGVRLWHGFDRATGNIDAGLTI
jgi:polyphosphate glucokinase